jgi:hypothetical protein
MSRRNTPLMILKDKWTRLLISKRSFAYQCRSFAGNFQSITLRVSVASDDHEDPVSLGSQNERLWNTAGSDFTPSPSQVRFAPTTPA